MTTTTTPPDYSPRALTTQRAGVLYELWQQPAGESARALRLVSGIYVDTRSWAIPHLARSERAEQILNEAFSIGQIACDARDLSPWDLTQAEVVAMLLTQAIALVTPVEQQPLGLWTLLNPDQVRALDLNRDAVRLRIFLRAGEVPAVWWVAFVAYHGGLLHRRRTAGDAPSGDAWPADLTEVAFGIGYALWPDPPAGAYVHHETSAPPLPSEQPTAVATTPVSPRVGDAGDGEIPTWIQTLRAGWLDGSKWG